MQSNRLLAFIWPEADDRQKERMFRGEQGMRRQLRRLSQACLWTVVVCVLGGGHALAVEPAGELKAETPAASKAEQPQKVESPSKAPEPEPPKAPAPKAEPATAEETKPESTKPAEPKAEAPKGDAPAKPKPEAPKPEPAGKVPSPPAQKIPEGKAEQPAKGEPPSVPKPHGTEVQAATPCPRTPTLEESNAPPAGDAAKVEAPAEHQPNGEGAEGKKSVTSPMLTAKLALMADPRLFPYDLEVDAKEQKLTLLGNVANEEQKKVAGEIIRCLQGVRSIENLLRIEPDVGRALSEKRDKVITQLVKERFEKSKTLQMAQFEVQTHEGIVSLSGATRFQVIVLEAAQAARQVPGVKAVKTHGVRLTTGD